MRNITNVYNTKQLQKKNLNMKKCQKISFEIITPQSSSLKKNEMVEPVIKICIIDTKGQYPFFEDRSHLSTF